MVRLGWAVVLLAAFSSGCMGFLMDALRPDHDNLVIQKDFRPDPVFGSNQRRASTGEPLTAKDIAKIPGAVWLEAMGGSKSVVNMASGFMIEFAGKPHVASAGHFCKGPAYKAIFAHLSEGQKNPEEVEIVLTDEELDFCLLRFKNSRFTYGKYPALGTSGSLAKGDRVFTHGSPFGYEFSVSEGIVNKLDFGLNDGMRQPQMIHHSARINPGDSGGPLFNDRGEIIGMNVMGLHPGWRSDITTIYGAVPTDDIVTLLRNTKESGHVSHSYIGWRLFPTSKLHAFDYERKKIHPVEISGLMVWEIVPGSPAEKSGFKTGDIILEYDGKLPEDYQEVARHILFARKPGDEVRFKVYREVRWTEEKLERDSAGYLFYNQYPKMEKKEINIIFKLEKK